jgi:hypothetical protein
MGSVARTTPVSPGSIPITVPGNIADRHENLPLRPVRVENDQRASDGDARPRDGIPAATQNVDPMPSASVSLRVVPGKNAFQFERWRFVVNPWRPTCGGNVPVNSAFSAFGRWRASCIFVGVAA